MDSESRMLAGKLQSEPTQDFRVHPQSEATTAPSSQKKQYMSILSLSSQNKTVGSPSVVQNGSGIAAASTTTISTPSSSTSEPSASCPSCGKEAKLLCTRCRLQKYCSQECQKLHWSTIHKRECQSIEGRTILVDVQDDDPNNNSNAQQASLSSSSSEALVDHVHGNQVFILKIQVALNSKISPMIAYDQSRSVYYMINATNCKKSQLLDHTIRTTGDVQGSKAYFNAKIRARDLKLIIYLDQRHGNLGW